MCDVSTGKSDVRKRRLAFALIFKDIDIGSDFADETLTLSPERRLCYWLRAYEGDEGSLYRHSTR
jgi:hypothetical protein